MEYRIKAVAAMLGVSDTTVRSYEADMGLDPRRQDNGGPKIRLYSPEEVFQMAAHRRSRPGASLRTLPRPLTLSVFLPKGGVGKSSVSTELSVQFALMGFRTLLVDLDPQGSSTVIFGYETEAEESEAEAFGLSKDRIVNATIANLLPFNDVPGIGGQPQSFSSVVKKPFGEYGPHLVPADVTLSSVLWTLMQASNRERRLAAWLHKGRETPSEMLDLSGYDIVIFDNSPSASVLSRASLVASDYCISPVRLDALSAKSLSFVSRELQKLVETDLPCPQLIAIAAFFASNTARSREIIKGMSSYYTDAMTPTMVRQSEIFPRSLLTIKPEERMPVSLQYPTHDVVREDLCGIANNILDRFRRDEQERTAA